MWKLTEFYNKIKAEVCNFCLGLTTIFMNGCGEMMDSVFHDLYEKYHQEIYQFIFYMTKNRETAEDLVPGGLYPGDEGL